MSPALVSGREWRAAMAASLAIVILASLPYLAAANSEPAGYRFNGLLFNAYDGNSYLAKMEIGRRGEWLFRLPYSAEPGDGAPIFLFYILLGHVAAWTGASTILVFHLARALAGLALLLALFAFVSRFFAEAGPRWIAWLLIAVGSGLGWLAAAGGGQTSDLWVAEAIVFLSLFANPHFPLAAALMLALHMMLIPGFSSIVMLRRVAPKHLASQISGGPDAMESPHCTGETLRASGAQGDKPGIRIVIAVALAGAALAHVQPFSLAILYAVVPATYAVLWAAGGEAGAESRWRFLRPYLPRLAVFVLASLPWLLLDLWLTQSHPALRAWSAQNLTPSPPVWDYLLTFSPALALAAFGAWRAARRRCPLDLFLLAWLAVNAALLYAPLALQRRLVHGLSIPVGLLAVEGLFGVIAPRAGLRRALIVGLLFALALPSNLLVMAASLQGVQTRHPLLYLTEPEAEALDWIDANTPEDALVLASPELGLFIPAYTARRVIYGHPFETIHAPEEEQAVLDFFAGRLSPAEARAFLVERGVDYVIEGDREAALGPGPDPAAVELIPAFEQDGLVVYAVQ